MDVGLKGFSSTNSTQNKEFSKHQLETVVRKIQEESAVFNYCMCVAECECKKPSHGPECTSCRKSPCLWTSNGRDLVADNRFMLGSDAKPKQRRYLMYRQLAFLMNGGPGGQRIELPQCCVDCIRNMYPEEDGQYVGHKDG